jgi:hypothetical protein
MCEPAYSQNDERTIRPHRSGIQGVPAVCLFLSLISPASAAYAGAVGYEITKYDIMIDPDFRTHRISVGVTIDIQNPELVNSFGFGLSDRYTFVTVTADSSPATVERGNDWIDVNVSHPTPRLRFRFSLSGVPGRSPDENRSVIADSSLFLLWSDRFYPIDFDRWAPVRTSILLPPGFQAIAPGSLKRTERIGERILHVFETSRPTVSFSVFADSRWVNTERVVNGIPMQTLLYPGSQRFAEQIFKSSAEILGFYSQSMCAYPFDRFSFITIDSVYARRAFPGFVGYSPLYLEKEFTGTGYDAHETALLWWGYTIRGNGPGGFQWTEGFGDYLEIMYCRTFGKPIPRIFERFRDDYLATPAEQDLVYTELRGNTPQKLIHGKYPWLMQIIRDAAGGQGFMRGLRLLFKRYRHRTFSMDEFISTLEEGTGESLGWWREEWLSRKGIRDFTLPQSKHRN